MGGLFTTNLFNVPQTTLWPEPGCMALAMVLMKNTLMRIAVLSANCQSGVWRRNIGSTVLTGLIGNGQQIPLPTGFSQNQCTWSVSNSENPHGWKPNYFAGQVAAVDANRVVTCGYYDEYVFHPGTNRTDLTGKCSFIISCS